MTNNQLVCKAWNYAHVLRDQGVSYGEHIEQITFLLFLRGSKDRGFQDRVPGTGVPGTVYSILRIYPSPVCASRDVSKSMAAGASAIIPLWPPSPPPAQP